MLFRILCLRDRIGDQIFKDKGILEFSFGIPIAIIYIK